MLKTWSWKGRSPFRIFSVFGIVLIFLSSFMSFVPSAEAGNLNPTKIFYIEPTDDAYVRSIAPDSNYGGQSNLFLMNEVGNDYYSFVRFNLSALPDNLIIDNAEMIVFLELCQLNGTDTSYTPQRLIVEYCTSTWDESTVTWNTMPTIAGGHYGGLLSKQSMPYHNSSAYVRYFCELVSIPLSEITKNWYDGTYTNYGIKFYPESDIYSGRWNFKSKDALFYPPPLLRIEAHSELSDVVVSYYNHYTGLGIAPWTFNVSASIDDGAWERITPERLEAIYDKNCSIAVHDYFGRELYNVTKVIDSTDYYWDISIPVYSYKFYNEKDYFTKIWIWYDGIGAGHDPYSEYLEPRGVAEYFLLSGDYTYGMTIYTDNGITGPTYWWNRTVSDAGFVILNGTTITEVLTTAEGLQATQEVITNLLSPDMIFEYANIPSAPDAHGIAMQMQSTASIASVYESYEIFRATRTQTDNGTSCSLYLPYEYRIGVTTTILSDVLSFTGNYSTSIWINTTTGTNLYNSTTLPAQVSLDGQNITIISTLPLSVSRIVEFKQVEDLTWTYYASTKKYSLTETFYNNLSDSLTNVYWSLYFEDPNDIDSQSIAVYDNENGIYLVLGNHFDLTYSGVHFFWSSISATSHRSMTIEAYSLNDSIMGEAVAIVTSYADSSSTAFCGSGYKVATATWSNSGAFAYAGQIIFKLDFTDSDEIRSSSILVKDITGDRLLNSEEYYYSGNTIVIMTNAVGTVEPGEDKSYIIAWTFDREDAPIFGLNQAFFNLFGISITPLVVIIFGLPIGTFIYVSTRKEHEPMYKNYDMVFMTIILAVIVLILTNMGVFD